ncbi:MAG TPA: hypothetical protein PLH31_08670, partial [Caulobacter sp.]|nr:hypothetical protein [Caulobacter sp.]
LVDAPDSKSGSERSVGSTPTARTINLFNMEDWISARSRDFLESHFRMRRPAFCCPDRRGKARSTGVAPGLVLSGSVDELPDEPPRISA